MNVRSRTRGPPMIPAPAISLAPDKPCCLSKQVTRSFMIIVVVGMVSVGTILSLPILSTNVVTSTHSLFGYDEQQHQTTETDAIVERVHVQRRQQEISSSAGIGQKYQGPGIPDLYHETLLDVSSANKAIWIEHPMMPVHWNAPGSGSESISMAIGACFSTENEVLGQRKIIQHLDRTSEGGSESSSARIDFEPHHRRFALQHQQSFIESDRLFPLIQWLQSQNTKGVLFGMFRNPIEQLLHAYYTLQDPSHPHYDQSLSTMSLQEYIKSPDDRPEFNYMVKNLVSSFVTYDSDEGEGNFSVLVQSDDLIEDDLQLAKQIVHDYMIILLFDDKVGSWQRLSSIIMAGVEEEDNASIASSSSSDSSSFLGEAHGEKQQHCIHESLLQVWPKVDHPSLDPQSHLHPLFLNRLKWDMELYKYAVELFHEYPAGN